MAVSTGQTSIMNLLARASGDQMDPALVARLRGLKSAEAASEAQAVGQAGADAFKLNPLFAPEDQSFSLQGNPPASSASTGAALLSAPQTPAQPQRKRLEEKESYKRYKELEGKWNRTPWFVPAQYKDRLEGQMDRTLRVAALEMADEQGVAHDSQYYANLLDQRTRSEHQNTRQDDLLALQERQFRQQQIRDEINAREARDRLDLERERLEAATESDKQRAAEARREHEARMAAYGAQQAAAQGAAWSGAKGYSPFADNPAATGVFGSFAEKILKETPNLPAAEVAKQQVDASKKGVLPPMMSRKSDAPIRKVAIDATGRETEFWVFPDGTTRPVEERFRPPGAR